jgi:predicted acylesterase/phospholipase RssA
MESTTEEGKESIEAQRKQGAATDEAKESLEAKRKQDIAIEEARASREAQRKRDTAQAETILRGAEASAADMYELAERLKSCNEFGHARKLFGRIRAKSGYRRLGKSAAIVGQRHALCTYKDPDLPAADRFERALEILDEVDLLEMSSAVRQESLGLRGAVYKRRWQVEGQRADLAQSRNFYLAGYQIGPEHDLGYTGINAAFVLDLLAREDESSTFRRQAREIRERLVKLLPELAMAPQNSWVKTEWWFYATRAEAHFGLGQFDEALQALRAFNTGAGMSHQGPPLERVPPWEFESTITQLASLAQLQADLAELLSKQPDWENPWPFPPAEMRERAARALREYLGKFAAGVDRAFIGKVGLALSGGGFRASLFHIGVLACLAEKDLLRHVEALSCVSGGSIVGAHYYLEVQRLLETKEDGAITREDYIDVVQRLERDFLSGVQTNIRSRTFGGIWSNLRAFLQPGYTTTRRLGELYEALLYSLVEDKRGNKPRYLNQLFVNPCNDPGFKPKYDNWRRAAKVPVLVLNATTLNTGHNWQFTASWMGEPPSRLEKEIGGNYRLRRMYHWEAPRLADKWRKWFRRPFAPPDYQQFRLGDAVAASSCVPGLFEPLVLKDLYDGKTVRLVDGGVYDNQGVASLLDQDCTVMIVSDASGQMDAQDMPSGGRLGVPLRSFSLSMARVRQAQFQELDARRRSGLLKGLMFLHLRKDLDADPVDWRECQDPHEASDEAQPAAQRGVLTRYGLQKRVQRLLSAIRTDLDSFTEVESFGLMTSGYRQAQMDLRQLKTFQSATSTPVPWRFLQIEPLLSPGPGFDDLTEQLHVGRLSAGKVWLLWSPLTITGVILALLLAFGLYRLWDINQDRSLLTVYTLGVSIAVLALGTALPHLVRIIRYQQTFRDIWLRSLLAAVLAFGFKVHLMMFDPLFLRLGRVSRLRAKRQLK